MYEPREGDISGRNFQDEMRTMLYVLLPAYEIKHGMPGIAALLVKEFNDMLEFAGATVVGDPNRAQAVVGYLNHHYTGAQKPAWYANLTGGQ